MASETSQAVLIVGTTETIYWRAGTGKPVMLLFRGGLADRTAAVLFELLAEKHRVFLPVEPTTAAVRLGGFPVWLRGVIDGLGTLRVTLVADEPLADAALAFALDDPDRVAGLVTVRRAGTENGRGGLTCTRSLGDEACALLWASVRIDLAAGQGASEIARAVTALGWVLERRGAG